MTPEQKQQARLNAGKTAIKRRMLSAPTRALVMELRAVDPSKDKVLDFGCGHGFDAKRFGFDRYDPEHFPEYPSGQYSRIICNYVLNVVPKDDQLDILEEIDELLTDDGVAYIAVRRDKVHADKNLTEKGVFTKKGTYQRLVELPLEVAFKRSGFVIYRMWKGDSHALLVRELNEPYQLKIPDLIAV